MPRRRPPVARDDHALRDRKPPCACDGHHPEPRAVRLAADLQREAFRNALADAQKPHFDTFLGPLIRKNFIAQPSSGPAFVQMAAQFFDALAENAQRVAELKALDVPVKLIWGQTDPYITVAEAERRRAQLRTCLSYLSIGGSLVADRRTGTSGKGDAVMRPHNLGKVTVGVIRLSKLAHLGVFSVAMAVISSTAALAQSTPSAAAPDPAFAVPTTKVLAIGSFTAKATPDAWKALVPSEMRQTAVLYLAGKIDQWYVNQDQSGVVFILNVTDPKEAKGLLDKLPLGQAGLMEFQFIPLGPLSPLRMLLNNPAK